MAAAETEARSSADIPIQEGYVGNLTDGQHTALVQIWESYFDICDRARGQASKGSGFKEENAGSDLKNSGIPSDDAEKDAMKKAQEQQGMMELLEQYGPEALHDSWWNFSRGDNPDVNMLRFVRARKGDIGRALAMMATCLKWRLDSDVESLIAAGDLGNGKTIPKFTEQQKSGKVFSLCYTTKHQPLVYVIMKHHSIWGQPAASMQKFIITQMESMRLFLHPPNDKATIIFDLKGFGLKQMDVVNLLYLVKVLESYYPETLGTMYVSNAPWIFWGFWKAVKNLLDPVVRDKIKFISSPADTEGDIPESHIITHCGGLITSPFNYVGPEEGENAAQEDASTKESLLQRHRAITKKFEQVTRAWCKAGGKDEALEEQRALLCKKLRLSHFELEPYTRGLNVYQRNGTLPPKNAGISTCEVDVKGDGQKQRHIFGKRTCRKSTEQELFWIAKEGLTVGEAEKRTTEKLKDGSWGGWEENDNEEEVRKVALESLHALGGEDGKTKENGNEEQKEAEAQKTDGEQKATEEKTAGEVQKTEEAQKTEEQGNGDEQKNGDTQAA